MLAIEIERRVELCGPSSVPAGESRAGATGRLVRWPREGRLALAGLDDSRGLAKSDVHTPDDT